MMDFLSIGATINGQAGAGDIRRVRSCNKCNQGRDVLDVAVALQRAGVTADDIDLAEIYDAFTYMPLVALEDLGFCAKGEGGPFVEAKAGRLLRDAHFMGLVAIGAFGLA